MSTRVESLRDLYVELTDEQTLTEPQVDVGSREPIDSTDDPGEEVTDYVREDGLSDALDGAEMEN